MAVEQPDEVGPAGVFEKSVADLMARDQDMTVDVAEMLVAAESLGSTTAVAGQTEKINRALTAMDEVQRTAAGVYDQCYDVFLDLYPEWRGYLLCEDPKHKKDLLRKYKSMLSTYNKCRQQLIQDVGVLLALEHALLPSNTYVDPDHQVVQSADTSVVLDNF